MKDFSPILEQARPGDLVMVRHGSDGIQANSSFGAAGIEWFSDGQVSHCFVCLGDGAIVEAMPAGGVQINNIQKYCKDEYSLALRRLAPPYMNMHRNTGERVAEAGKSFVGSRYDFAQIGVDMVYCTLGKLGWTKLQREVARHWKGWKNGFTCSELCCAAVWKGIGVDLLPDNDFSLATPQDLLVISNLVTICVV